MQGSPGSNAQETQGLLSPMLRDIRLNRVSQFIDPGSLVLDLACGDGYLRQRLPKGCRYLGVDRRQTGGKNCEAGFLCADLCDPGAFRTIREWLPGKPDFVLSVAFLEHITTPEAFVGQCLDLLADGERSAFIGTTPHPRGRIVHDTLAKIGLCSQDGAEEHETFLGREALSDIASRTNSRLDHYSKFLFGLNQVFVYRRD
ncbi:MAG: class I SAM-dependent methyltransferase [Alphaproteobacteria bacterium]|nr:class I SAM-dependent methyltransferase [Alphaproteobacteria bacterium]